MDPNDIFDINSDGVSNIDDAMVIFCFIWLITLLIYAIVKDYKNKIGAASSSIKSIVIGFYIVILPPILLIGYAFISSGQRSTEEISSFVAKLLFALLILPICVGSLAALFFGLVWVITLPFIKIADIFKEYVKRKQNIKEQARKAELERQQKLERERKEREERAERARQQIEERERQRQAEKEQKRQEFLKEKELMTQKYGGKPISDFVNIPEGSTIGSDNLPREINAVKDWGDKYTFYQQKDHAYRPELNHYKYHKKTCHYAPLFSPINAYELKSRINQRCMLCQPVLPDMEWVDEYRKIQEIKKKYDIE